MTEHALKPTPGPPVSPADALAAIASIDAGSPRGVERLGRFAASLVDVSAAAGVRERLVAGMHDTLGVDSVHLVEISQDAEIGGADVSETDETGAHHVSEHYTQALDDRPSGVATAVRTQRPLHVPRARESGLVRPDHVERWNAASLLFAPLLVAGEVRLVAIGIWHEPTDSDPAAIELAVALTQIAALSLARIDAEERSRAEVRHHASLVRAARALNASLELPEVLSALCREADFALGGDIVGVYLGDAESGGVAVAGHGVPPGWEGQVMPPGAGVAGQTLVTGRTAITNDYQSDIAASHIDQLDAVRTAVSVPVCWDDQLRGALSVGFNRLRRIDRGDVLLLEAIADLAATACQNAAAYEKATAAASTDSLTGVLNHGAMQVHATREIERARRSGESLSLVVLDLDDFKALNDTYGHHAGDRFLRRAAAALDLASRPYDALARYGGDEFVLVLPGADSRQAILVAERLRAAVRATTRELGLSIEVDASVGAAQWCEPLTSGELFDRADRALLLAKRRGKHTVVLAGPETDEQLALLDLDTASTSVLVREFWEGVASFDDAAHALRSLPGMLRRALDLEDAVLLDAGSLRPSGKGAGRFDLGPRSRSSLTELLEAFGLKATCALPYGKGSYGGVPLLRGGTLRGLLLLRCGTDEFPTERLQQAELIGRQAAMLMSGRTGDGSPAAVRALAAAIDARDNYTHEHSAQVVSLASEVARRLRLPTEEVERVERAALLHDVGKVAIPNEILHKPGPLDDAEWAVMREHPVIGEQILRRTPELADIAPLVRHEHERWDGHGYPDGIAGEDIPVGARIILACDAYNAMITRRPYREPMPPEAAIAELRANAGKQFDPAVVDGLLDVLGATSRP